MKNNTEKKINPIMNTDRYKASKVVLEELKKKGFVWSVMKETHPKLLSRFNKLVGFIKNPNQITFTWVSIETLKELGEIVGVELEERIELKIKAPTKLRHNSPVG